MFSVRRIPSWDGLVPEWVEAGGTTWLSRGPRIFRADGIGAEPQPVAQVPLPAWKSALSANAYARRLLRLSCYNVMPLTDGRLFVSFDKSVLIFERSRWTEVGGLARPSRILRGGCALTPDGDLFFGEYFSNADRTSTVHVYRLAVGETEARIVRTFAPGEIRHVHGIHYDELDGALWLFAGDHPAECRIIKTHDQFKSIDVVGAGDESWRAIHPVFTPDAVYYATDSEYQRNFIYRVDRASGQRNAITEIDGPSYYGAQVRGRPVFATTVELCPSQRGKDAVIWAIDGKDRAAPIQRFRKDLFASRALIPTFQVGLVMFAATNARLSECPFTGSGLIGLDRRMFAIRTADVDGDRRIA